jgi:hypothetical protein
MRRTTLALACSLLAPVPASATDAAMQQWKAYAQRVASPAYAWSPARDAREPTVFDSQRQPRAGRIAVKSFTAVTPVGQLQMAASDGVYGLDVGNTSGPQRSMSPLSMTYAATTLVRPLDRDTSFSVTAIIARQRFATPGFGSAVWDGDEGRPGIARNGSSEFSHGSGVRIGVDRALGSNLGLLLGAQSRLEMDSFKAYRGVFSEPGDFDVPGFVQTGLRWSPSSRTQLSLDAQRVFYSEVDTFTSAALPVRLLALLGDGGSPVFAWRDLTVYSAELSQGLGQGGRWSVRLSSQQQPRPTSAALDRALAGQYSNTNVALGFNQALGGFGRLNFAASYTPASYFLAASPYLQRDFDGTSQFEFEAQWAVPF